MPILKTSLTLKDLPAPPPGKTGWPWTEATELLPEQTPEGFQFPLISIVTPSYNQGQFLEETIRSILLQGYPNLEYIIVDGGSTDNTLEIIKKYESYISYWVSEPDRGQSHAINKGFIQAQGELIGWQNSDDYYYPHAFYHAARSAVSYLDVDVCYGSRDYLYPDGNLVKDSHMSAFDLTKMIPNANMSNHSMFFRKRIFEKGILFDESFHHCMDHDLFWRLIFKGYQFLFVPEIKACYRLHDDCKGLLPDNTWMEDTVRICKSVYQNTELPKSVREQAWAFIRYGCLKPYIELNIDVFHQNLKELIAFRGITALDSGLISRYVISLVGARNLQLLRRAKGLYQPKPTQKLT